MSYEDPGFRRDDSSYLFYIVAGAKLKTAVIARPLVVEAIQISKSSRLLQALRAFAMTKNGISRQRLYSISKLDAFTLHQRQLFLTLSPLPEYCTLAGSPVSPDLAVLGRELLTVHQLACFLIRNLIYALV